MNSKSELTKKIILNSFLWTLAFCIPLVIGLFYRLYPITVFPSAKTKIVAESIVYSKIRSNLKKMIYEKYDDLPDDHKEKMLDNTFLHVVQKEKKELKDFLEESRNKLLGGQGVEQKDYHLMGADSYYYYGLTKQLEEKNKVFSKRKGRQYYNPRMLAPIGHWYPIDLHPYSGLMLHKILDKIKPGIPIKESIRWLPILLSTLCLIIFLFICHHHFNLNPLFSCIGGITLMLAPTFLKRSMLGWYDTDPYNVLFPLCLYSSLLFLFSSKSSSFFKEKWVYLTLAALTICLYGLFWRGWLVPTTLINLSFFCCLGIYLIVNNRVATKPMCVFIGFVMLIPLIWNFCIWGPEGLTQELNDTYSFIKTFISTSFSMWPDATLTIGELNRTGLKKASMLHGGILIICLSFASYISGTLLNFRSKKYDEAMKHLCLLILSMVSFFLAIKLERLLMFSIPLIAIGFALSLRNIFHLTRVWIRHAFIPKIATNVLRFSILCPLIISIFTLNISAKYAHAHIVKFHPIFNDTWQSVMHDLRDNSPKESIVTSWWSPGHFITGVAERSVSFDGATQDSPSAYWISNLFLKSNELSSLGILRMINHSGNNAIEYLVSKGASYSNAINLLQQAVQMDSIQAVMLYQSLISFEEAKELVELTHPKNPKPTFLLVYNHMVEQILALEFIGNWQFEKAEIFSNFLSKHPNKVDKKMLKRGSKENLKLLWSVSKPPTHLGSKSKEIKRVGDWIFFSNKTRYNASTGEVKIDSEEFGKGNALSVFKIVDNDLIETIPNKENPTSVSVLILKKEDPTLGYRYYSITTSRSLAASLVVRLFYFKGNGLKFIKPFSSSRNPIDNTEVATYKVDWDLYLKFLEDKVPLKKLGAQAT